jgi:hypothetical protein
VARRALVVTAAGPRTAPLRTGTLTTRECALHTATPQFVQMTVDGTWRPAREHS